MPTIINPYLTFKGNCEEAFNFYLSVFGGEFRHVGRFNEMPADPNFPVAEVDKEKIMHISLPISEETVLMGSDVLESNAANIMMGTNFSVSINLNSETEADRLFNKLSAEGKISMPLNKTFWGSYFGMFTDKFGIQWMINCSPEAP